MFNIGTKFDLFGLVDKEITTQKKTTFDPIVSLRGNIFGHIFLDFNYIFDYFCVWDRGKWKVY